MDIRLTPDDLALQRKARAFTDDVLVPLELECEWNDGLTPESAASAKAAVLDRGFNGINHATADGGQGHDLEGDLLALRQSRQTSRLHGADVNEDILRAVGRLNETITLLGIEPLHCTGSHVVSTPQVKNTQISRPQVSATRNSWAIRYAFRPGRSNPQLACQR